MADGGNGADLKKTRPEDESAPIPGQVATNDPSPVDALPGALAGRYEVLGVLPGGRQARVFRVRGRNTGADLVLKLYHHGTADREAVLAQLGGLQAPHVLRPVEVGREDGRLYEVQQYAAGGNLADLILGGVGDDVAREVVRQLVDALAYLHESGIAHRDLKPGNVLLRRDPAQGVDVALADFGSSALPATAGREGPVTCAYAPPEGCAPGTAQPGGRQSGGSGGPDPGRAADCWALGMLVTEMLTGRHPLLDTLRLDSEGSIGDYLGNGDLEALVDGVSDPWRELCRGLLCRDLQERWTVAAVRAWLRNTRGPALQPPGAEVPPRAGFRFVGREYATGSELAAALARDWRSAAKVCRNRHSYNELCHWILNELGARDAAGRLPDFDPEVRDDVQVFRVVRALDGALHWFRGMLLTPASVADLARMAATDPGGEAGAALRTLDEAGVLRAAGERDASLASVAAAWTGAGEAYARLRREYPVRVRADGPEHNGLPEQGDAKDGEAVRHGRREDGSEPGGLPEPGEADRTWLLAASTAGSGALDLLRQRVREVLRTRQFAFRCRWFQRLGGLADAEAPALMAMRHLAAQAHADVVFDRRMAAARAAEIRRNALAGAAWGAAVGAVAGGLYVAAALAAPGWLGAFAIGFVVGLAVTLAASAGVPEGVDGRPAGRAVLAGVLGGACAVAWSWVVTGSFRYLAAWLPDPVSPPLIAGGFVALGALLGLMGARPQGRERLRVSLTWGNAAVASLLLSLTVSGGILAAGILVFPEEPTGSADPSAVNALPPATEPTAGALADAQVDAASPRPTSAPPSPAGVRDCPFCPALMVVPAGRFRMGSDADDALGYANERPVHTVELPRFALGRFEVTRAEYAAFVAATGRDAGGECLVYDPRDRRRVPDADASWTAPGIAQEDDHPVVCVNWDDAQAYVQWLSGTTGREYRLPSEAEWEYAARAGTATRWVWGNEPVGQCRHANGLDGTGRQRFPNWRGAGCSDGAVATAPAGSFAANGFGLHDMAGNVGEWVADCWHRDYVDAPRDGSAWERGGDCAERVLRGGSWADEPALLRSAGRGRNRTDLREAGVGFRVAVTMDE